MTDRIDPSVLERYPVKEKIGQGAYGIVYSATDRVHRGDSVPQESV